MQVTDPVCDMTFEEEDAKATSTYEGRTYYFCCEPCKETFEQDPEAYADET